MKKVIIIGCPGSGKSTFARRLSEMLAIPLVHLDLLNWNADKTVVKKAVFMERLDKELAKDSWIIDGNYGGTLEKRFKSCDTVFFLDLPVDVCLECIEARKGKVRSDMPWIETGEIDPEFIDFIKQYHTMSRPQVLELIQKYPEKIVQVFQTREEVNAYLMSNI